MKQKTNNMIGRKPKAFRCVMFIALAAWLAGCGEYFAPEVPDEYDTEQLPHVKRIDTAGSYELFVGDKATFNPSAFTISNGKTFAQQTDNNKQYLLNSMVWSANHGDSVVMARVSDLCITAKARGTDTVTFYNASASIGSCRFIVHDGTEPPTAIHTDRAALVLMEGDSWTAGLTFEPSYTRNTGVLWESANSDVVTVSDEGTFTAVGAGTTTVTVSSAAAPDVKATITVTVLPDWRYQFGGNWRYETIVYALLDVDGEDCTLNGNIVVAAILDGSNHGTGRSYTWFDHPYMVFRVGNNALPDAENSYVFGFWGYDSKRHVLIDIDETFDFDTQVHGTLSNPVILHGSRRE